VPRRKQKLRFVPRRFRALLADLTRWSDRFQLIVMFHNQTSESTIEATDGRDFHRTCSVFRHSISGGIRIFTSVGIAPSLCESEKLTVAEVESS
jgi:hypothetical protein